MIPHIISAQERAARKLVAQEAAIQASLPSRWQMLKNLVEAAKDVIVEGTEARSTEEIEAALKVCAGCPHLIVNQWGGRCGKCGCKASFKVKLKAWKCPIDKW